MTSAFRFLLAGCLILAFSLCSPVGGVQLYGGGVSDGLNLFNQITYQYRFFSDVTSVTYYAASTAVGVQNYRQGVYDFMAVDTQLPEDLIQEGFIQLPLMASALVIYHSLNITGGNLVLSGPTLAGIWLGNITRWNDERLVAINPNITLPDAPIRMSYFDKLSYGVHANYVKALASFDPELAEMLKNSNYSLTTLPPALEGRAVATSTAATMLGFVKNNANAFCYLNLNGALAAGMPVAWMKNRAGNVVAPTSASVTSAMNDFRSVLDAGGLAFDLANGAGANSWPMGLVVSVALYKNTSRADCSYVSELLQFIAWTQVNEEVANAVSAIQYVPLSFGYKKRVTDLLSNITCNNNPGLPTAFLVGMGPSYPIFNIWLKTYGGSFQLKYFNSDSSTTVSEMIVKDLDFAAPNAGFTPALQEAMPDVKPIPTFAFAVVPGYNVPELYNTRPLTLSMSVIADIMLNKITKWNDPQIVALNTDLPLPNASISVVYYSGEDPIISMYTAALSRADGDFNNTIGIQSSFKPPITPAGRLVAVSSLASPMQTMSTTTYTFALWTNSDLQSLRNVKIASLDNWAGNTVAFSYDAIISTLNDWTGDTDSTTAVPFPSETKRDVISDNSWPMVMYNQLWTYQSTMNNCNKASALVDWLYWVQTNSDALATASHNYVVPLSQVERFKRVFLNRIANMTCKGVRVSAMASCIYDGTVCSDHGECFNSACLCNSDYEGKWCQTLKTSSDGLSTGAILGIVLGISIPLALCLVCVFVLVAMFLSSWITRRRRSKGDWEIDFNELELGEQLGAGGYGEVHKAMWKGTEVAVKTMVANNLTKEMERDFREEVRVMTALRHPNVVLFMAACTKPPNMCIVMEFMSLGSLFDYFLQLLHNELIPELPLALKIKTAYQAAKGMHFLHSSGIVHRDLKSLNLLLDSKWNVKVSDFGLTKFRSDMKKGHGPVDAVQGSIHWTAPEILNETVGADYILADVYSFGIIMWEILTREQPYEGMSPAAIAVAVIRDQLRPTMPAESVCPEYEDLIRSCWHEDPTIRPTFLEIMTRLTNMANDTSNNSYSSSTDTRPKNSWSSFNSTSSNSQSNEDGSSASSKSAGVKPPEGEVTIVFTDITRAASLWEFKPNSMKDATVLHNELLRSVLNQHRGYEVIFAKDRNTGEGSFCMAFHTPLEALDWCMTVQEELLKVDWPKDLLEHPGAAEEWSADGSNRVIFRGLRVRMGVHLGRPHISRDPITRRTEYHGPVINTTARITSLAHCGQIILSHAVWNKISDSPLAKDSRRMISLGLFDMPDTPKGLRLFEVKAEGLEGRFFGGVSTGDGVSSPSGTASEQSDKKSEDSEPIQDAVGEGMQFKEDHFLTSANLCRWVIDYKDINMGRQIGMGSYGVVFRGKWKGVEVAVKKFIKQKLDERHLLEFRAEMAFLSELHHPNIVLFIGACVKMPNLCIVTEYVKQGGLRELLSDNTIKLSWSQRLRMLRSAALGINYLHSLEPVIVHRDLKPSNLLVDENWNVKVADFGFARIKEENTTMTRCGSPCWTAPEVIRGEKYDERADIYSYGIIMWEVLTRKQPFSGRNFMGVSLDVLEGKRPQIPVDCPERFKKVMKKCWHNNPDKRPTMEAVITTLDSLLGQEDDDRV